jgi:DNA-directed RNA polymerase specialized sigma24 family protein
MAVAVVISDEELSLTATEPTVGRGQFALELEKIFEQHYQFVYRTAYTLTGSAEDAEDITQTIFMRLLAREFPPDLQRNPEPYLYRAAFNLSLNTIRQRKRQVLTDNIELVEQRMVTSGFSADELDRSPGEKIVEAAVAQQLGVGQGLIREALIGLEDQGFCLAYAVFKYARLNSIG